MGVLHTEGIENPGLEKLIERLSADYLDQCAEDVCVVAIDPLRAGMGVERQRCKPTDGVSDRFITVGKIPPLNTGGLPTIVGRTAAVAHAGGVGE